jgi:hypothetical protein
VSYTWSTVPHHHFLLSQMFFFKKSLQSVHPLICNDEHTYI